MRKFAAGLLACLVVCLGAGLAAADEPVGTPVPQDPAAASGVPFGQSPVLVEQHATPAVSWFPTPNGIAVGFTTGPQACFGVTATVVESPEAVTVDLRTGTLPEAVGRACTMNLVYGTVELPLAGPIGDREVRSIG